MTIWIDFETASECDLKTAGVYNYARHPSTRVLCMAYAIDDGDVRVWTPGEALPAFTSQIRAHNAAFERLILRHVLKQDIPLEQFYCTAAQARSNCAPGSLEDVGRFAGASMRKDHRGAYLVRQCCIPPFKTDLLPELFEYCAQDVRAMRAISLGLRELTEEELADYHANERINDRGVRVDLDLCRAAQRYAAEELREVTEMVADITGGLKPRSPRLREWVFANVSEVAQGLMTGKEGKLSLDKTVRGNLLALANEGSNHVQPHVADVIQCADDIWASSVAKFARLEGLAGDDGRVRGAFVFAGGAATGRASSYGAQVHNFARKCADDPEAVRRAMVRGHAIVPTYGKRVTDVLKGMLRPALIPDEGKSFVVSDWSAIEGRVNPWLSGRGDSKLQQFRDHLDPYIVNAAATFATTYDSVTDDQRQIGKVQELACLSEDTLVLTLCGDKPIQDVLPGDFVWDGEQWVITDGPVYKGERYVVDYDGLCATPDHLVWVEGKADPVEFGWAAANGLPLVRPRAPREAPISEDCQAPIGGQTAMREPKFSGLRHLRRALDKVRVLVNLGGVCLGVGEHRSSAIHGYGIRPDRQRERVCAGESSLVYESAEPSAYVEDSQHVGLSSFPAEIPRYSLRGQYVEEPSVDGADLRADSRKVGAAKLQTKRRVWDLLNCGPLHRFTAQGRLVHNCGFGGGVGAFAAMGRVYGLRLPEHEARRMVAAWRGANPWAPLFWSELELAYNRAMHNVGKQFTAGRITYMFDGQHLWYALPSGRVLCYPHARFEKGQITYAKAAWKPAADAKHWPRAKLWHGLACENVTQATAHDLLREAVRRLDGVVLHVHDEIVLEADAAGMAKLQEVMTTPPAWADGLPLEAKSKVMGRYGK